MNGSGNKTWTELEKYCSSTRMNTPSGTSEHPNPKQIAREKHSFRGKNALYGGVNL
jgi:hypothetical protein